MNLVLVRTIASRLHCEPTTVKVVNVLLMSRDFSAEVRHKSGQVTHRLAGTNGAKNDKELILSFEKVL